LVRVYNQYLVPVFESVFVNGSVFAIVFDRCLYLE